MRVFLLASLAIFGALASLPAQTTLILKSGQQYELKEPAKARNGMVSFTTKDGRFLSVKQSDIAQEVPTPTPTARKPLNGTDSRELGEIARQTREERGVSAPVAPKEAPAKPKGRKNKKTSKKNAPKETPESETSQDRP